MRIRTVMIGVAGVALGMALAAPGHAAPAAHGKKAGTAGPAAKGRPARPVLKGIPDPRGGRADTPGWRYVSGYQYVTADGASVKLQQAQPGVAPGDDHSLAELAVQSADGNQIVEIGWTVSRSLSSDGKPHLFVFHWVDHQGTCYNGCGFVSTSNIKPGQAVPVGDTGTYQIQHRNGQWQLSYNGAQIGYFPDSLWGGRYTRAGLIQAFGEVSSGAPSSCTDMGNATFGHADTAAHISDFALLGGAAPASLTMKVTHPSWYDSGAVTPISFRFGGPGAC